MNDITKLPKWAQSEIISLRNQVADLNEQLSQIQHGGNVLRWQDVLATESHGIPDRAIVVATVEGGEIELTARNGLLDIRAYRGAIIAQPLSSNWLRVKSGEYWG